ncbi:ASCH domain-containing protein [Xanthomonas campestris]|uniref:ASCH domain-containing protein n=1 Tax=Xanthomonas campestris TaxID=339 RepID=UPI0009B5B729|nr:ASCH domain-containing protein [Xanthomonas campestris]QCX67713.1 ASCH domain-containing protein [Xanthomonas campestris pv. campestris]QCX71791.1 ASCH domain-containing protein [Xanthomonas campestris pv. campestris]
MKGLVIDEPWISLILSGQKTWEMRSRATSIRGRIALIKKGSGTEVSPHFLLANQSLAT